MGSLAKRYVKYTNTFLYIFKTLTRYFLIILCITWKASDLFLMPIIRWSHLPGDRRTNKADITRDTVCKRRAFTSGRPSASRPVKRDIFRHLSPHKGKGYRDRNGKSPILNRNWPKIPDGRADRRETTAWQRRLCPRRVETHRETRITARIVTAEITSPGRMRRAELGITWEHTSARR